MISQKRRRWLVVFCYATIWTLILLGLTSKSIASRYLLMISSTWVLVFVQFLIFYKLANDTVFPKLEDFGPWWPISLGLSRKAHPFGSKPDERQVAVRNAAYFKAYRIVAVYLLLSPIVLGSISLSKMLWGIYMMSMIIVFYTLPQAIILWTEPDIPEEAI